MTPEFAPWTDARRAIPTQDGWRDLAVALGGILLIEVVESAIWSSFVQVFGIYHASPGSTRVRVFAGFIRPALGIVSTLALYTLACVTTLRAIRRVGRV